MSTVLIFLASVVIVWFGTDLFRKGQSLNKMVIAFGKIHLMLNELTSKIEYSNDLEEHKEELFVLAYLFRREIYFRLDQHKWSMNTPLIIPGVSDKRILLLTIFDQTISRIRHLSREIGYEGITQDIMDGKEAYFEFDKALPTYFKDKI